MISVLNATDVRKHWSEFNDDVIRNGPRFVKRNRDYWAALSTDHLTEVLSQYSFTVRYLEEKDGTITATLNELDIAENGDTREEALSLIVDEMIEYANEYLDNFNMYYHAHNRRGHFPYILKISLQNDAEGVKDLIDT